MSRNLSMVSRIEAASVEYPMRFVIGGDSGAWPDPTADGIFRQLVIQIEALRPRPAFFVNLGDFAGPGTPDRHANYLELVDALSIPNLCVVGNHDLDDETGASTFEQVHGPMNFDFAVGHTRFVVLHAQPGVPGQVWVPGIDSRQGTEGPRDEDLEFLEKVLQQTEEPYRVLLVHMPPYMQGHYAPHADWGFRQREDVFFRLLKEHDVALVCCAHGLAFDTVVHEGIRFVMSGGGGAGLCSHRRGICAEGDGHPEDRGSLFHVVEIAIFEEGTVGGRVLQAFAPSPARARLTFGASI